VSFEFRRQGLVWLEDTAASTYYKLHTGKDVTFSQTFKQSSIAKRTLHDLNNLFEGSEINEANPADFSFQLYLVDQASPQSNQHKPLDLLLNYSGNSYNTFNLYFVYEDYSPVVYYKIENCVFTNGTFNIPTKGIVTVSLSGEGAKLTRNTGAFPGTDSSYRSTERFVENTALQVTVGSDVLDNILGASLEVQNEIQWTPNNTLQKSLDATNAATSTYPSSFSLSGRKLGGSISQYVSKSSAASTSNLQTWQENVTVRIRAGNSTSSPQLDVNMPNACSFTNRAAFGELFTQNYDYRLITSPNSLSSYFTY
jgi:hypothetical protein